MNTKTKLEDFTTLTADQLETVSGGGINWLNKISNWLDFSFLGKANFPDIT